jgi:hypothetical protein
MISKVLRVTLYFPKKLILLFFFRKHYEIKVAYYHRRHTQHYDDTAKKDEWQKEVYEYALKFAEEKHLKTVLDYGCGSAYKLLKYFKNYEIVGVDVEPTLSWLKKNYPETIWFSPDELIKNKKKFDLIICADCIEHISDPDQLINSLKKLDSNVIVLSTPDRDLINNKYNQIGPPLNSCHCREWNFEEFKNYIGKNFRIIDHCIINKEQCTQLILCTKC